MESLKEIDNARKMDEYFRTMDMDRIPIGKPIDERSLVAAASDRNVVSMHHLQRLQEESTQNKKNRVQDTWSQMARSLPKDLSEPLAKELPSKPTLRSDIPKRKHILLQTYQDIANDLRNFKKLPYKTNLEKLGACFFGNNRSYLSITTFIAICIILIVILFFCIRRH